MIRVSGEAIASHSGTNLVAAKFFGVFLIEFAIAVVRLGWGPDQFFKRRLSNQRTGDSVVPIHTPYGHDAVGPFDGPAVATSFELICHHVPARPLDQSRDEWQAAFRIAMVTHAVEIGVVITNAFRDFFMAVVECKFGQHLGALTGFEHGLHALEMEDAF